MFISTTILLLCCKTQVTNLLIRPCIRCILCSLHTLENLYEGISVSAAGINAGILNALMFVTTMQLFGNDRGSHVWGYINVMMALGKYIEAFSHIRALLFAVDKLTYS